MVLAALARVQVVSAHHPTAQPATATASGSSSSSSSSSTSSSGPNTGNGPAAAHYSLPLMDNNRGETFQTHGNEGDHEDTVIQADAQAATDNFKLSHATLPNDDDNNHHHVGDSTVDWKQHLKIEKLRARFVLYIFVLSNLLLY